MSQNATGTLKNDKTLTRLVLNDTSTTALVNNGGGSFAGAVTMSSNLTVSGTATLTSSAANVATYTSAGAISETSGFVYIGSGGVLAMTLADPVTADNGKQLTIIASTAHAHTVSNAAGSGFNGGGAGSDVGTYGGAIGDNLVLTANGGVWYVVSNTNVTLA